MMSTHQAFITPTLPHAARQIHRRQRVNCYTKSHATSNPSQPENISRRRVLLLPLLPLLPVLTPHSTQAAQLSENVTPILMCRKIMKPVSRYIEEGSWDKGRTNVNYCTRVLALRRNMREAASLLSGDAFYDAMDIMGELDNTMTQLDASLYTSLFIPADEGISPEQKKYQTQARGFYAQAIDLLEGYIRLVPQNVLENARNRAANAKYEIRFEDE